MSRILHLVHFFPPESRGGTQEYVARIAARQRAGGDTVRVVTGSSVLDRAGEVERTTFEGQDVVRLLRDPATELFSGDLGAPRLLDLVLAEARDLDADVVHLHHWHGLSHGLVGHLTEAGFTVVVTLHDLYTTCLRFFRMPDYRRFCDAGVTFADCARCVEADLSGRSLDEIEAAARDRFRRFQDELSTAARVLCVSAAQRDLLTSLPGFDFDGLDVLRLGLPAVPEVEAPTGGEAGRLRVVYWGGIDPRKGSHVLAEAAGLASREIDIELTLHGDVFEPSYREEIERLAAGAHLDLPGRFEDAALDDFARTNDVAVFPFLAFETHALAVDEALLRGLPVIVSQHGAPPERIGERGATVPADDPGKLAEMLVDLGRRPERLAAMRRGAHGASTLEHHMVGLDAVYREVTGGR